MITAVMAILTSCGNADRAPGDTAHPDRSGPAVLKLHPENPRYFEYDGEPVALITSAEHYGALLNLDFDFREYLKTLREEGFNYTRIFTGTYIEPVENIFGIEKNTLAPLPGKYLSPWISVEGKYDLKQFNPAYFERLGQFMAEAEEQGIMVEVTLFSSIYAESAWVLSPMNPRNNIQSAGPEDYRKVHTLFSGTLLPFQERFIRKMVRSLNGFGNLFFEIQNEPWADHPNLAAWVNQDDTLVYRRSWQKQVVLANHASMEWQRWVAGVIRDEESSLSNRHVIAQNICNFGHRVDPVPEAISVLNFHYAHPFAVLENLNTGRVIGLDETGFMPQKDALFIDQAWRFMLSGGGLYNNLDYSFTAGYESGTWEIPAANPGWGGPVFRKKLAILAGTMDRVPFHRMDVSTAIAEAAGQEVVQTGLASGGEVYLLFLEKLSGQKLRLSIPAARYTFTWIDVESGREEERTMDWDTESAISCPFEAKRAALLIRREVSSAG